MVPLMLGIAQDGRKEFELGFPVGLSKRLGL